MRISRQTMLMEIAKVVAKRATCFRLNVGAVITVDDRIVSYGYNGTPPGAPHCTGNDCPGRNGCKLTIHAEENAFEHIPPSCHLLMKDLYVTDSPCLACAQLIAKNRVKRFFFGTPYRDTSPLDWLNLKGVALYRVMPNGDVIDWVSGAMVEL